jgi:hypothetical protein
MIDAPSPVRFVPFEGVALARSTRQLTDQLRWLFDVLRREVGPLGVVAVVVGADGETLDLCICNDDDAVEERSRLLLDLYADDARAVVFATVRAGPPVVRADERARFERLRAHGESVGLPVLDWFIVGDGASQSLDGTSVLGANVPPERQ